MKLTNIKIIALLKYATDKNDSDGLKRTQAKAIADTEGLLDSHGELLPDAKEGLEMMAEFLRNGETLEEIVGLFCEHYNISGEEQTVEKYYRKLIR